MTSIDPQHLAQVRAQYAHCFGCGLENPIGLQVDRFERDGQTIRAEFTPRDDHRGFHDILHGGIVATALDEILAWTGILVAGTMALTAKIEMRFRNPAPALATYQLEGRLVEQQGRRLLIEGRCLVGDTVIAEANALFLATDTVDL